MKQRLPHVDRPLYGIMLRLAAAAMLSIMFGLVKYAGNHGVHVAECLFWRQLAGLPVVIAWLWWSGNLNSIATQRPGAHVVRMILGISAMALNFLSVILLPMGEATTIGFAMPIFATLLAALILGEKTGRYRWSAILLGFIGVVFALQPGNSDISFKGLLVALSGAAITACISIQLRNMSREESTGAIVFWFSLSSLIPLGIAMTAVARNHDLQIWGIILALSITGGIAQILLTSALRYGNVAVILTMDYSALIWTCLIGFAFFGDYPSNAVWVGAPMIIGAGIIIAWREHYLSQQRASTKD